MKTICPASHSLKHTRYLHLLLSLDWTAWQSSFHYPSERQQDLVFVTLHTHSHSYPCYSSKKEELGLFMRGRDDKAGKGPFFLSLRQVLFPWLMAFLEVFSAL